MALIAGNPTAKNTTLKQIPMNNNNNPNQVTCGVCGKEIDPNDWHPCTPLPEPIRLTAEEIIYNNIDWDSSSHSRMYYSGIIAAMQEYAAQEVRLATSPPTDTPPLP